MQVGVTGMVAQVLEHFGKLMNRLKIVLSEENRIKKIQEHESCSLALCLAVRMSFKCFGILNKVELILFAYLFIEIWSYIYNLNSSRVQKTFFSNITPKIVCIQCFKPPTHIRDDFLT